MIAITTSNSIRVNPLRRIVREILRNIPQRGGFNEGQRPRHLVALSVMAVQSGLNRNRGHFVTTVERVLSAPLIRVQLVTVHRGEAEITH